MCSGCGISTTAHLPIHRFAETSSISVSPAKQNVGNFYFLQECSTEMLFIVLTLNSVVSFFSISF